MGNVKVFPVAIFSLSTIETDLPSNIETVFRVVLPLIRAAIDLRVGMTSIYCDCTAEVTEAMPQLLSMMAPKGRPWEEKKMLLLVLLLVSNCVIHQSAIH